MIKQLMKKICFAQLVDTNIKQTFMKDKWILGPDSAQ